MFTRTWARFAVGVSPYVVFVKEAYKNKELKKQLSQLTVPKRGKLLGKLYKALKKPELAKLKVTAAKTTRPGARRRVARKAGPYAEFTRTHMKDADLQQYKGTERLRKIAELWNNQKA